MRGSHFVFGLAVVALLGVPESAGAQSTVLPLAGEWIRTERPADDAQRTAELERITAPLSFFTRGIARMLLESSTLPAEVYIVGVGEGEVSIRSDGAEPVILRVRKVRDGGDSPLLGIDFTETGFVHYWQHGPKSRGTTRWRLSADATRLTVITKVLEDRFDGEFSYVANYQRRDGRESAASSR